MEVTYQDPAHPASFGGVDALHRAIGKKVAKKEIRKWLQGVDAYTLHKPVRRKFVTNRVIVYSIDQQWQADLVDLNNLKKYNQGYRYILTCIDILSKYGWMIPLKNKTGDAIVNAFQAIFSERKPQSLQCDAGTEFKNKKFQNFLKERNVRFFTTFNTTKASVVERFNRTMKTKMWKYFTSQNTYKYIDVLNQLVTSYNHSYHSSIKRAPVEVTQSNEKDVWLALYGDAPTPTGKCQFNVGDIVRVSKAKLLFEKGYETNWTEELFKITECVSTRHPSVYRIQDLLHEPIQGTFYREELQPVRLKEKYAVEKILKKRFKRKRLEYWVKFRGYPDKFNQWIPASDLTSL